MDAEVWLGIFLEIYAVSCSTYADISVIVLFEVNQRCQYRPIVFSDLNCVSLWFSGCSFGSFEYYGIVCRLGSESSSRWTFVVNIVELILIQAKYWTVLWCEKYVIITLFCLYWHHVRHLVHHPIWCGDYLLPSDGGTLLIMNEIN